MHSPVATPTDLDFVRAHNVVRSNAGLAVVDKLAPHNTPSSNINIRRIINIHGALASQLQNNGRQVLGSRLVDDLGDLVVARVEDVVESLLQQRRCLGDSAIDNVNTLLQQNANEV